MTEEKVAVSKQDSRQASTLRRPTNDDKEAWKAYWKAQSQTWRTEPEIDTKRQQELAQCRAVVPSIEKGIYPFKDMKLSRADVEWLLAMHENGRGPVNWSDGSQQDREGLEVRGADLSQEDLTYLPLTCMQGGLPFSPFLGLPSATEEQRNTAAVRMQGANLRDAQLQGAVLSKAQLQGADLRDAQLQGADLRWAQLQGANLRKAQLQGANLRKAQLQGANLRDAQLDGVDLNEANLSDEKYG